MPPTRTDAHPPAGSARRRRLGRWVVAAGVVLGMIAVLQAPLPAYVQRPGPAFGLAAAVDLPGADPIRGDFLFLTVRLDDATTWSAFAASLDGDARLVSRDAVLGGESEEAFIARQESLFDAAERTAVGVGLEAVGSDLTAADVQIDSDGVGGPSAGLLVALAVADLAAETDLAAGRRVAGTGTVDVDGRVGPVGSVADKVAGAEAAGADVFVVPAVHAEEAREAARSLEILAVGTVAEAVAALTR